MRRVIRQIATPRSIASLICDIELQLWTPADPLTRLMMDAD